MTKKRNKKVWWLSKPQAIIDRSNRDKKKHKEKIEKEIEQILLGEVDELNKESSK